MKKVWMVLAVMLMATLATSAMAQSSVTMMGPAQQWQSNAKLPGAILDTFAVYNGTATLRKCAIGSYFKGASDDTIRVVAAQSASPRRVRIMTDTSVVAFGANKFRMDSCAYGLASGGTATAMAIGDIDGDGFTDILTANTVAPFRIHWFEWDGGTLAFEARDSFTVNAAVNDIIICDANNDGNANEIVFNIAQTAPSSAIMRALWTAPGVLDTTRILLSGTQATRGVAFGEVRGDLSGKELYVAGGTIVWMVRFNGAAWDTATIVTGLASAWDVAVGDIDPTMAGNEIAVVHGSASYQVSVTNWTGTLWSARLWNLTGSGSTDCDIAIGDIFNDNPGNEVAMTLGNTLAPRAFWVSPVGVAWTRGLPMGTASVNFGVAVGNVNRFSSLTSEFVMTGMGGRIVAGQQRSNTVDLGTQYYRMANGAFAKQGVTDTVEVNVFNSADVPASNFYVRYRFKTSALTDSVLVAGPVASGGSVMAKIGILAYDFTGFDTMYVFPIIAGDVNAVNDTTKLHIEPNAAGDSAVVWSGFNTAAFAPTNATYNPLAPLANEWKATILTGTYNWRRITSSTNPTTTPLEGAGMAQYDSYNASSGSTARLRTNQINVGPSPKKVRTSFYFFRDADTGYHDSLDIQFSFNDTTWTSAKGFIIDTTGFTGWRKYDVEIGDFAANTKLYVGFYGRSNYGNRKVTIDSVRVYTTTPTPPTITGVSPAYGATDVGLNEPIVIAFSEPMDTLSVAGNPDPMHNMTISWNATMDTMTLAPDDPYPYNTVMSIIATAGTDLAGNPLAGLPDTVVQFTTIANQGPEITMVLQPGDTYDGTGPFMVQAVIADPAKKGAKQGISGATIYYSLNGLAWNSGAGVPMDADTFNFGITGGLTNGTLVSYYIEAEDDQGDFAYSPANAPIGVYNFRILDPLPPTALTAQGLDMAVQLDWAPPAQVLAYSSTVAIFYSGLPVGFIQSTRFTPMHYPCKLEQATSIWYDGGLGFDTVIVHVYADDGTGMPDEATQLVTPFRILPEAFPTATVVDLSGYNIVLASGEFHVGYELVTAGKPAPVSDAGSSGPIRSLYKWIDGLWWGDLDANWTDEAVVSYSAYTKGLALKSSHLHKGQKPNYATGNGQHLKPVAIANKQAPVYPKLTGALAMAKNILNYSVRRGTTPGGPYTEILSTGDLICMDQTAVNGTPYYYVVRANYSTPDTFSAFSNEDTASPAALPILLVDDDGSWDGFPDVQAEYTAALDAAGQTGNYSVYNSTFSGDGPNSAWMSGRTHVIWFSGEVYGDGDDSTLTPANEATLGTFLDAGGRLFLSAQDYIYDRYRMGSSDPYKFTAGEFPYDYLGVDSVDQDFLPSSTSPFDVSGVGLALTEGMAFTVANTPLGWLYPDNLTKLPAALDVFDVTAKVGEKPAVQYSNGTFRTVFFAFPFENLEDSSTPNTKGELMYRILNWMSTGVEGGPEAQAKPTVFSLAKNYPNPLRTSTTIKFALPKNSHVRMDVYNVAGQKVKTLVNDNLNAGHHSVPWNGANDNGQKVAAGVYLVRMATSEFSATRKMTVLR